MWQRYAVGCSYTSGWEVGVNWLACIEPLLLSRYFGGTFDSMRAFLTEVWVASCKTMYLDINETWDIQFGWCLFLRQMWNMMDELIGGTRESVNEVNVVLHITSFGIQCGNHVWELRRCDETPWDSDLQCFPSSNMSVAFLYLSIENQKGGYIKLNWINSLNTVFHEWHLYCLQVAPCLPSGPHLSNFPPHFTSSLHNVRGCILGWGPETCVCSTELSGSWANDVVHGWLAWAEANWMDRVKSDAWEQGCHVL